MRVAFLVDKVYTSVSFEKGRDVPLIQLAPLNQQSPNPPISGTPTELAMTLTQADKDARYDENAKKILTFKAVTAVIVKDCTHEFQDVPLNVILNECLSDPPVPPGQEGDLLNGNDCVTMLQQEYVNDNRVKQILDNCFVAYKPGVSTPRIPILCDFEPQNVSNPGYPLPKRGSVYTSHLVIHQVVRKDPKKSAKEGNTAEAGETVVEPVRNIMDAYDYSKIHKVYSIWICTHPKAADRNTIVRYRTEREVIVKPPKADPQDTPAVESENAPKKDAKKDTAAQQPADEPRENYDIEEVVIINLGTGNDDEPASKSTAINLLNLLFLSKKDIKEKESIVQNVYHIAMGDKFKEVMDNMGSFAQVLRSEAAYDRSLEIAKALIRMPGHSAVQIATITKIDEQTVLELADEMGVDLPQKDPDTP